MKKRRKTEGIYSHSRESWDPSIRSRFESSLPAKGDPRTNEKSPPPIFLASYRSARKGVQGPRRKNRDVKRDYDWTRFPSPLRAKLPTVFPLEARQIILETRSFDRFVRRASIFPSAPPIRVRASDGGAANLAQPRISMRTLPATYLWTSAVTFEKGSRRYESSRKILVERERDEVAEGRGEQPERVVLSSKRFLFESIKLIKMTTKNFLRLRLNGLIDVS